MKLEKKHWIIIGVVVAIVAVWYFFLRKRKTESGYDASQLGGTNWLDTESGYRMVGRGGGVGTCPPGQKPCGMSQTGCCPENIVGKHIVCPPGMIMMGGKCIVSPGPTIPTSGLASAGIAGTSVKETGIGGTGGGTAAKINCDNHKCPEGFSPFGVSTPSGPSCGCRGYVAGKPGMQYTN